MGSITLRQLYASSGKPCSSSTQGRPVTSNPASSTCMVRPLTPSTNLERTPGGRSIPVILGSIHPRPTSLPARPLGRDARPLPRRGSIRIAPHLAHDLGAAQLLDAPALVGERPRGDLG